MQTARNIAIGFVITTGILAFALRNVDTNTDCDNPIKASEVSRWIETFDGQIDYRNGTWYDGATVKGYSATEDSDVCVK